MADNPYQIKENIRRSDDNIEKVLSSVRPLTRSDVKRVMDPLREAERTIENAEAKSQNYNEEVHDLLRFEMLVAKAMLALHTIDHGTRGEPLNDYRGLTTEQKIEQIDKHLLFAEERLSSISAQTIDYYYNESYRELEEAIFVLRNRVEKIAEELTRTRIPQPEESYTQSIPQPEQSTSGDSSSGSFMVGVVISFIGLGCLMTGIGAVIGVPLLLLGGAIMFPTLATIMIGLMLGAILILLL